MKFFDIKGLSIMNLRYELGELEKLLHYSPPKKDEVLAGFVTDAQMFHLLRCTMVFTDIIEEIGKQRGIRDIDFLNSDSFLPVLDLCHESGLLATNHRADIIVLLSCMPVLHYDRDYEMSPPVQEIYDLVHSKISRLYLALQKFVRSFSVTQKELVP